MAKRITRCGQALMPDPRPFRAASLRRILGSDGGNEWVTYTDGWFSGYDLTEAAEAKLEEFYYELSERHGLAAGFYWYPVEIGQFSARFFYYPHPLGGRVPNEIDWLVFGELAVSNGLYWHKRAFGIVSDLSAIKGTGSYGPRGKYRGLRQEWLKKWRGA